jgi:hypothetical protein
MPRSRVPLKDQNEQYDDEDHGKQSSDADIHGPPFDRLSFPFKGAVKPDWTMRVRADEVSSVGGAGAGPLARVTKYTKSFLGNSPSLLEGIFRIPRRPPRLVLLRRLLHRRDLAPPRQGWEGSQGAPARPRLPPQDHLLRRGKWRRALRRHGRGRGLQARAKLVASTTGGRARAEGRSARAAAAAFGLGPPGRP